jgi:predicted Zn-dependent protease
MKILGALFFIFMTVAACSTLKQNESFRKAVGKAGEMTGNEKAAKAANIVASDKVGKAFGDMTPRQEYYLGRTIAARVMSKQKPIRGEAMNDYVNTMGRYLAIHSKRPETYKGYQFAVIDDSVPTALSAPGGYVFVSRGMVNLAQNEEELAAVLAHEIGHISLRHAEKAIQNANQLALAGEVGSLAVGKENGKTYDVFKKAVEFAMDRSFSQGDETTADAEAVAILASAGYRPQALLAVLERMKDSGGFLKKHPSNATRLAAIRNSTSTRTPASTADTKARDKRFKTNRAALK